MHLKKQLYLLEAYVQILQLKWADVQDLLQNNSGSWKWVNMGIRLSKTGHLSTIVEAGDGYIGFENYSLHIYFLKLYIREILN